MEKRYYRVETLDNKTGETRNGLASTITAILAKLLNITPNVSEAEWENAVSTTVNANALLLLYLTNGLLDMEYPEVYEKDKDNHYCLYTEKSWNKEMIACLMGVNTIICDASDDRFELIYKEFSLEDSELLYKDNQQIVISKATYDKHNTKQYDKLIY